MVLTDSLAAARANASRASRFRYTVHLVQNLCQAGSGNPVFNVTFTFTHTNFEAVFSNWFVREYTDPDFTLTLNSTSHRTTCSFDLTSSQLATSYRLQTKGTEGYFVAGIRQTTVTAQWTLRNFVRFGCNIYRFSLLSTTRFALRLGRSRLLLSGCCGCVNSCETAQNLALEDPNLNTDNAVGGMCFRGSVVDVCTQSVQGTRPSRYHSVRAISGAAQTAAGLLP